jgi:hypothetical protein
MVELREEILDQVTRLYFERRRLQVEMMNAQPAALKETWEQQLRIDELTALIDGFTGGQFSRMTQENNNAREVKHDDQE